MNLFIAINQDWRVEAKSFDASGDRFNLRHRSGA
jgi:hypothetical protein